MLEKLQNQSHINSIVVLNDFFLDRIIKINNIQNLFDQIQQKKLGGSIRGFTQTDIKGGNATNVAYALAKLGCPVSLITIADKTSSQIIRNTFSEFTNVSLFIIDGNPGKTTSFEFVNDGKIVNVMISDLGDNENFGPERIGNSEKTAIQKADAVIMTNWASNRKATELSSFVFSQSPSAIHLLDPADIQSRSDEFVKSLSVLKNYLHSLCINENEFGLLVNKMGLVLNENTEEILLSLSKKLEIPIDLHTVTGSHWSDGKDIFSVKSYDTKVKIVTGAGDVWDAANTLGYLVKLDPVNRLNFANATASLYVGNPQGIPPTLDQVLNMIK